MDSGSKNEALTGTWARMESLLDQVLDTKVEDAAPHVQKIIAENSSNNTAVAFDQGVYGMTPDMFELAAGMQPDLHAGDLMSRYRIIKPLGSGGMGDVYLAERADGQYEQQVALKILSVGLSSPVLLDRFQREVQILAELRHPGIASLLDAGIAEDGRPWFVLDYIQGIPLTQFCKQHQLDHTAIIDLFIKVCHAVGFAHENGIIHRDLKPENILVEGDADEPQPIVLDFGIASRAQEDNLTQVGLMLGTPTYTSPEQAKGDHLALDQRSDIFLLGILLYELIDQHTPFNGESNTDISYHIIHQDTPPLTQTGVSPDLAAIIFKCMRKSPDNRYASVQKLIEDLENYQSGKSVKANPVGFWFRLARKIRRDPLASLLILITTITLLALGGIATWQGMVKVEFAAQQALTAQYYGQAAQQIESNARLIYSRPLHNIENELHALQKRYQQLNKELVHVDPASQHVAHYALGRAALSLGLVKEAQDYLQQAWHAGLQEPLLALRLGQTYMQQYGKATQSVRLLMLSSAESRKFAFDKARKQYLQPAMKFLSVGATADHEEANIAKAIMLYMKGDPDAAQQALQQTIDEASWPVTAMIASGNFFLELAENSQLEGNKSITYDYLLKSENLFKHASQIARSHPAAINGHCMVRTKLIQTNEYQQQIPQQKDPAVIEVCDALLVLKPNSQDFLLQVSEAYVNTARQQRTHGDNPTIVLEKAKKLVLIALQHEQNNPQALRLLGSVQMTESTWIHSSGGDGKARLNDALESFERAAKYAPGDGVLLKELTQALQRAGRMEYANGRDGDPAYIKSSAIYQQLIKHPDTPLSAWIEYADILSWQAYYRYSSGRDAESILRQAIKIASKSVEKAPQNMDAIKLLAMIEYNHAEFHYVKNEDPAEMSASAFEHYQKVIDKAPSNCIARINQLGPMALATDFSLNQGKSQKAPLAKMHQLLLGFEQCKNEDFEAHLIWADYWRYQAKQTLLENGDPSNDLKTAHKFLDAALKGKVDRYEAVQTQGYIAVFEHQWRKDSGKWDGQQYAQDVLALTQLIAEYPDLPLLRALRGQLNLLHNKDQAALAHVVEDFTVAIAKNPLLKHRYGTDLLQATKMLHNQGHTNNL